jgi:hypothetical protein
MAEFIYGYGTGNERGKRMKANYPSQFMQGIMMRFTDVTMRQQRQTIVNG